MALSRNWTALETWREAFRGVNFPQNDPVYNERFVLINRAVNAVIGQFYDLLSRSYMTSTTAVPSNAARYLTGTAGWTAATRLLTATMDTNFTSSDVGKLVVFHEGTTGYAGTVESFGSTTTVVLKGDNLPAANITLGSITYVILLATNITGDVLDLSSLKIMRYGQQISMEIQSTETTTLEALELEKLRKFRSGAPGLGKTIVWSFVGDTLYLDKGDELSTYGTLTIFYPAIPIEVTADADYLDVPDGTAIEIVILKLKSLVAERTNIQLPDQSKMIESLIRDMYRTFGAEIDAESLKSKVVALK